MAAKKINVSVKYEENGAASERKQNKIIRKK